MEWLNILWIIVSGVAMVSSIILATISLSDDKFTRCLDVLCACIWAVNFTIRILMQCGLILLS